MAGFFRKLGRFLGSQSRKANWVYRSLTGTDAEKLQAEHAVGRDLAHNVLEEVKADPDPAVARWLVEIGGVLEKSLQQPERAFNFRALLVPEPNAFALPGGFIFVTRSLLKLCEGSHDDLAFVLGHEMAHVVRGHAMERMMAQSAINVAVSRWNPLAGLLRLPVSGVLTTLLQQGYSREQELEADRVSVELMQRAGFDGKAAVRLFGRLGALLTEPSALSGYFSSHPSWEVRIQNLATH